MYPDVTLKQAREQAARYRSLIAEGKNPRIEINRLKFYEETLFEDVCKDWYSTVSHKWTCSSYKSKVKNRIEKYVLPSLGKYPISKIDTPMCLSLLKVIEKTDKLETMRRVKSYIGQTFDYGIIQGKCNSNPVAMLSGVLKSNKVKHYAHLTHPSEISGLLNKIDAYDGSFVTSTALKIAPYVFLRPSELVGGEWSEINFKNQEWRIPAERMKMDSPHIIPLAKQVIVLLEELQLYSGGCKYLFPHNSSPHKTMSIDTLRIALRRLGYSKEQITTHGLRHMASTRLYEMSSEYGWSSEMIERQLSHAERNKVKAAYNHAEYLKDRKNMMQVWANYLEMLKTGMNVLKFEEKIS